VPAAHYMCGGVAVDDEARGSLAGLYAIGEVACTGIHGANRLASNSLLEAVYFASRAAERCQGEPDVFADVVPQLPVNGVGSEGDTKKSRAVVLEHDWDQVRRVMWDYVGIVRDRARLDIALTRVRTIRATVEDLYRTNFINPDVVELRNIALLAELIVLSARSRHESRGLHYTTDYPQKSEVVADTDLQRGHDIAGQTSWEGRDA